MAYVILQHLHSSISEKNLKRFDSVIHESIKNHKNNLELLSIDFLSIKFDPVTESIYENAMFLNVHQQLDYVSATGVTGIG